MLCIIFAAQFYSCPPVDPDAGGICSEECSADSDCSDEARCCPNGCGRTCTNPITIPYHSPALICPELPEDTIGICSEECNNCREGELCCSNGCGHACTLGVSPTPLCSSVRESVLNSSLIGSFAPQCEKDGSFSSVQCHSSTGYCWCVATDTGKPVTDLATRFTQPQCSKQLVYCLYITSIQRSPLGLKKVSGLSIDL